MGSHAQPTEQQLKPMVENGRKLWATFTKAATVGVISVVVLLSLMAAFLIKHT